MPNIEIRENQSLLDIALEQYGDIEGVKQLVEDNNLNGIVDSLFVGDTLRVSSTPINTGRKPIYNNRKSETLFGTQGEGIGYWVVNRNFVVI